MHSLVMGDMETGTEWSHLLGRGMLGSLKDRELQPIVTDMVTWEAWKNDHPDTTVLDMSKTSKNYSRDFYQNPTRFVFGFVAGGKPWTLPMADLVKNPVHSFRLGDQSLLAAFDAKGVATRLFDATVDGRNLTFHQVDDATMKDNQTQSRWGISSGEAMAGPLQGKRLKQRVGIMSFSKAWQNFHPESKAVAF